jgi:tetratricopeptide (TPR) repeat protein
MDNDYVLQVLFEASNLTRIGDYDGCLKKLEPFITTPPVELSVLVEAGRAALLAGKNRDALVLLLRAWQLEPRDGGVNSNLGDVFLQLHAFDEALKCYQEGQKIAPTDYFWKMKLGDLEFERKNFSQALSYYEAAIQLCDEDDDPTRSKFMLALCQVEVGQFASALPFLRYAVEECPSSDDAQTALAKCEIALARQRMRP